MQLGKDWREKAGNICMTLFHSQLMGFLEFIGFWLLGLFLSSIFLGIWGTSLLGRIAACVEGFLISLFLISIYKIVLYFLAGLFLPPHREESEGVQGAVRRQNEDRNDEKDRGDEAR